MPYVLLSTDFSIHPQRSGRMQRLNDHPFFTTLVETTLEASFLKR